MANIQKIERFGDDALFADISELIRSGKNRVSKDVNSTIVLLYWSIGKRIGDEVLGNDRANYGEQIIKQIAKRLTASFGRGYDRANLFRMVRFARLYPDSEIVATVSRQLSWSHVILICQVENELARDFYTQMASIENWSVRTTREKVNGMLFERTAISKRPEQLIRKELDEMRKGGAISPDLVFKDPCFLDFLNLDAKYSENDLERSILDHITEFLGELGTDFCFVARQKRMSTTKKDRYLDLLFFHRGMRRLVAIELKLGPFEPEHKGQMEWYLRWLDKNERKSGEGEPIGIILCSDKDKEDVEYLEMDGSGIHVSQYITYLPPKEVLQEKLHKAIAVARESHNARLGVEE